jgi:hypothetical protein
MTTGKSVYYVMLLVVACSCGQHQERKQVSGVPDERIDFYSFTIHKDACIPDQLVREKTYIKLDASTGEALFKSIHKVKNQILYNRPIDNNVYAFSSDGVLEKVYRFDFGKKNVPDEYKKAIEENWDQFESRCCLKNFVVVNERYCLGTLLDELQTKTFLIDRTGKELYISEEIATGDMSYLTGYSNGQLITYIYPGKYDDIQSRDLPDDVKAHIEKENFVLCLYTLK